MDCHKRGAYQIIYSLKIWRPKDIYNSHTHQDYGDTNAIHIISLVVHNFGVKYVGKEHDDHLIADIR